MASELQAFPKLNTPLVDKSTGVISIPWYRLLISLWNRTGGAQGGLVMPTGGMIWWGSPTPPDGFFLCDGTAISRTANADLFAVIGVTFGAGDGVSTFNLPNVTDRTVVGAGGAYPVGTTGGAASVTLAIGNLPAHSHTVTDPGHTHIQDAHAHGQRGRSNNTAGTSGTQLGNAADNTSVGTTDSTTATNQTAVTGITIDDTGSGDPFSILPPFLALYLVIKS